MKIVFACLSIVYTLKEIMSPRAITLGFSISGQYPLSFETIMSRCYKDISADDLENMKATTESDLMFFLINGYLSEEQLDKSNIPVFEDNGKVLRDQKQLSNQRAVLISHPQSRNRYTEYMNQGLPIGDVVLKASSGKEKKELKNAIKIVATVEKRKIRAEKKVQETARIAALSVEERTKLQAEKTSKLAAQKAQKIAKIESAKVVISKHVNAA